MEDNLDVVLPKGIKCLEGSGHHTGVCCYYKKAWWLRLYHVVTLSDCSPYLLDAFGRPVSSNYSYPKGKPSVADERGIRGMLEEGCRSSISNDVAKMNISKVDSLHDLMWRPWRCRKYDSVVHVVKDADYRIGFNKLLYSFGDAMKELNGKIKSREI